MKLLIAAWISIAGSPAWAHRVQLTELQLKWSSPSGAHSFSPPLDSLHRGSHQYTSAQGASLEVRRYGSLVALRFKLSSREPFVVQDERIAFEIAQLNQTRGSAKLCDNPAPDCFHDSHEGPTWPDLGALTAQHLVFLPILSQTTDRMIYIGEANLGDNAGGYLRQEAFNRYRFESPHQPQLTRISADHLTEEILEREDFIGAFPAGTHTLPWRFFYTLENATELLNPRLLAPLWPTSKLVDTSWIDSGYGTEEWMVGAKIDLPREQLGFDSGVNSSTYQAYIDFARNYGLKYVILDNGWSTTDIFHIAPQMNLSALKDYANARGVKLILWVRSTELLDHLPEKLDYLKGLGASGLKLDFYNRDDLAMIRLQNELYQATADRHLVLIMHGVATPAGQDHAYPHILGWEAGMGHEYNKWSTQVTPQHKLDLLLYRNPLGIFDFEGANFRNLQPEKFKIDGDNPFSQGTRASEIAFYALLNTRAPILAGNLGDYIRSPEQTRFLTALPTQWDEVRPLSVDLDDHALVAKRKDDTWYVMGISSSRDPHDGARALTVKLGEILQAGHFRVQVLSDCPGPSAPANCANLTEELVEIEDSTVQKILLGPYGGYVARYERVKSK